MWDTEESMVEMFLSISSTAAEASDTDDAWESMIELNFVMLEETCCAPAAVWFTLCVWVSIFLSMLETEPVMLFTEPVVSLIWLPSSPFTSFSASCESFIVAIISRIFSTKTLNVFTRTPTSSFVCEGIFLVRSASPSAMSKGFLLPG